MIAMFNNRFSTLLWVYILSSLLALAAPIPAPTPMETGGLKQATRGEIIARLKKQVSRAIPSPTPPPREIHSGDPVYALYHQGSGLVESDNNPGNQPDYPSPQTTNIPGTTPQNSAIKRCADFASAQEQGGYFSFQLYYDQPQSSGAGEEGALSDGRWICTAYFEVNSDSSYFNVARDTAGPVFGYSVKYD